MFTKKIPKNRHFLDAQNDVQVILIGSLLGELHLKNHSKKGDLEEFGRKSPIAWTTFGPLEKIVPFNFPEISRSDSEKRSSTNVGLWIFHKLPVGGAAVAEKPCFFNFVKNCTHESSRKNS